MNASQRIVLDYLRAGNDRTVAGIRAATGLTKRQIETALWHLTAKAEIEYDYPAGLPLTYKVST